MLAGDGWMSGEQKIKWWWWGRWLYLNQIFPYILCTKAGGDTTTMCGCHLKPVGVGRAEREKKSELHIPPPLIWPKKDRCLKFFRKFQSGLGDYPFRASGSFPFAPFRYSYSWFHGFMVFNGFVSIWHRTHFINYMRLIKPHFRFRITWMKITRLMTRKKW